MYVTNQCLIPIDGHLMLGQSWTWSRPYCLKPRLLALTNGGVSSIEGKIGISTPEDTMASPSTWHAIDSSILPTSNKDDKGSEWRPKSRHSVIPLNRGKPKPSKGWQGFGASVVVKGGNAVTMAKGCRQFSRNISEVSGCGMPKNC